MMDIKQKWRDAEAPEKLMIAGGALMALLILVLLISMMIPKKKPVQQFVQETEDPLPAVYERIERLEGGLNTLNEKIEQAVAELRSSKQKTDASYEEAFGTLAEEVENHRVALESLGRLQAVPKSIRVIHENKGEARGRDVLVLTD